MKLDTIHHIAIIGRDRDAMLHFYVDQLGFAIVSEYDRPERGDILINLRQGQLTLELFIKPTAPDRPKLPLPEHAGLRHLAFQVDDKEGQNKIKFHLVHNSMCSRNLPPRFLHVSANYYLL